MPEKSGKVTSVLNASSKQKDITVRLREIKNGWIVTKSWIDGKGRFHDEETFSETEPTLGIDTGGVSPKPKRRRI